VDLRALRTVPFFAREWSRQHADKFMAYDHRGWPTASVAGLRPGEPMMARDRHQDGQLEGQSENIMQPLQAILRNPAGA